MPLILLLATAHAKKPAPAPVPAPPPAAETGQTFETGGVTLWYEVRGSGAGVPLLVVNGGPGFDHAYLHVSDVWDRLAEKRRVVMYDQRGVGRSSALGADTPCGLAEQIADLEAVRAQIGADRVDLVGHSWGGYLVLAYAARHPEHVAHLVVVDGAAPKIDDTTFLFDDVFPETSAREAALAFAIELGDADAQAADLREYLSMIVIDPALRDAMLAKSAGWDVDNAITRTVWTDLERFDLGPELPKLKMPTLVVTGRLDFNVAPSDAWAIHQAIPGSEWAVFEKSGHLPFYEEPEAFRARLEAFLGK